MTAAVSGWYTHGQECATAQEDRADGVGRIHQSMCVCPPLPHQQHVHNTPAMVQQARREHRMRNDRVRPGPGAVLSHPAHQPARVHHLEFSSDTHTYTHRTLLCGAGRPDLASGNGATVPGALTGNAGGKSIFSPMGTQNAAAGSPGMSPGFGGTTTAAAGGTSPSSYGRASSANLWATSRPASQARNSPEADMVRRDSTRVLSHPLPY